MTNSPVPNPFATTAVTPGGVWQAPREPFHVGSPPTTLVVLACLLVAASQFLNVTSVMLYSLTLTPGDGAAQILAGYISSGLLLGGVMLAIGQPFIRAGWMALVAIVSLALAALLAIVAMLGSISELERVYLIAMVLASVVALVAAGLGLIGSIRAKAAPSQPALQITSLVLACIVYLAIRFTTLLQPYFMVEGLTFDPIVLLHSVVIIVLLLAVALMGVRHIAARITSLALLVLFALISIGTTVSMTVTSAGMSGEYAVATGLSGGFRILLVIAAAVCIGASIPALLRWKRSAQLPMA